MTTQDMSRSSQWLVEYASSHVVPAVDGLVPVDGYDRSLLEPEEVAVMEKAQRYGASAVFFEAPRDGKPSAAQAFIFRSEGSAQEEGFGQLHQRLWSWGGVPLAYRVTSGLVQLFRCAHRPDFESGANVVANPFKELELAAAIAAEPWWDAERLRNGTLWDDPSVCKELLSSGKAAQKTLIDAVKALHERLQYRGILPVALNRRLLVLSVLIAYLEARQVFEKGFFAGFKPGANSFFEVLADGRALIGLLDHLDKRFNGHVFVLSPEDRGVLSTSDRLAVFAELIEGRQESTGQRTLWQRYSFADLPVELISHIYQLFVGDTSVAVYTPHFVVRLMLGEVLSWDRLDRLNRNNEVILDGACGSGIFLVEAYKRLVLHWRYRNGWKRPDQKTLKELLTSRLRGVDLEASAVELAAFSLCLALCDALEPTEIRASVSLFPPLKEVTIHTGCFFEAREQGRVKDRVGVIVGNPPFESKLSTDGAKRAYDRYQKKHGALPDKQLAYLFLHESMEMLAPGGALCMLQQYNFLYNQQSLRLRREFLRRWDVREILDFISVRGLFQKGNADTKVIVVVAEASAPPSDRLLLHATFRRSGRADAEQGFDIDYYDMHWLPRELTLNNDGVWRSDLLGGGRVLGYIDRLRKFRTLGEFARSSGWDFGEGYVEGARGVSRPASHISGKPLLPSDSIDEFGIDPSAITVAGDGPIEGPRSEKRFTPPMLLFREHMELFRGIWTKHYLTYKNKVVGFCPSALAGVEELRRIDAWIASESAALRAYVAGISVRLFTQKATTLSGTDIEHLPYPADRSLGLSGHEQIIVSDIVNHYRDLVRLGEDSYAMKEPGTAALPAFNEVFTGRINGIYRENELQAHEPHFWPGVICQPYSFASGKVDWDGSEELRGRVDALLQEKRGGGLNITRIARLYDGACIYMLKPDRLRYWLRSVALRDADETLADLVEQGF